MFQLFIDSHFNVFKRNKIRLLLVIDRPVRYYHHNQVKAWHTSRPKLISFFYAVLNIARHFHFRIIFDYFFPFDIIPMRAIKYLKAYNLQYR